MLRVLAAGLIALAPVPVSAQPASDTLVEALYSGDFAEAGAALMPRAAAGEREAQFGAGLLTLAAGVEDFLKALHRHGLREPDTGMLGMMVGIPVEQAGLPNPDPEPLDYAAMRAILEDLLGAMDAAHDLLVEAGTDGDYVVSVDVMAIQLDPDEDPATPGTTLGALLAANFAVAPELLGAEGPEGEPGFVVGFDRADAYWLAGYSQVVAAQAEFLLAHDFEDMFEASFHLIFPRAGLPMQDHTAGATLFLDPRSDVFIADMIAFIHTFSFPVAAPDRLANVQERLKRVTALSRLNWAAILEETDDERELVPSPDQTSIMGGLEVTEETVAAWHATLDTLDAILAGELLVPHWRFAQGIDLDAYFREARRTDLVLLLGGYDALPFLRDGPVAGLEDFAAGLEAFGEDFPLFMLWFN